MDTLGKQTILRQQGVDEHFEALIAAHRGSTWFATQGIEDLVCQNKGSRPGDTFADLVFNLTFGSLLAEIEPQLANEDLLTQIQHFGGDIGTAPCG